jgi:acylglycerol lipase
MEHFETSWKLSDGLGIFAQGWDTGTGSDKGVICLVHGVGEHTGRYLHVAESFNRESFAFFGADLMGHGRSEGPRGHFPSIELVLEGIDVLIDQAKARYPGLPVILYGHSLGGILVLYYTLRRKPAIKGVIATSPGLRTALEQQPAKVMAARILGTLAPKISMHSGLDANAISHEGDVVNTYNNDPLVHDRFTLGFGKIMLTVVKWTLENARDFPLPLLLLHGKDDSIAFPSGSMDFAAPLGSKCKLVLYDNALHELHNEPFREEVFKTMTDWIKQLKS